MRPTLVNTWECRPYLDLLEKPRKCFFSDFAPRRYATEHIANENVSQFGDVLGYDPIEHHYLHLQHRNDLVEHRLILVSGLSYSEDRSHGVSSNRSLSYELSLTPAGEEAFFLSRLDCVFWVNGKIDLESTYKMAEGYCRAKALPKSWVDFTLALERPWVQPLHDLLVTEIMKRNIFNEHYIA